MKPQDDTEKYRVELAWAQKVREIYIRDQIAQMREQNRDESDVRRQEHFLRGQRTAWPLVAWAKKYADEKHVTDADLEQVMLPVAPEEPKTPEAPATVTEGPAPHEEPAPEPATTEQETPDKTIIEQLKAQILQLEKKEHTNT